MTQNKTRSDDMPAAGEFMGRLQEKLSALRDHDSGHPGHWSPNGVWVPDEITAEHTPRGRALERAGWRLPGLGVPDDATDALATGPTETRALIETQKWWAGGGRCLVLAGEVGVGKTVAAAWCLREAIANELEANRPSGGETRRAEPAAFALSATVARMSAYGNGAAEAIEALCSAGVLVIDDFGREKLSEVASMLFDEVLTRRLGKKRCRTILTSNLGVEDMKARVGGPISDRLRDHGTAVVIVGPSLRGKP